MLTTATASGGDDDDGVVATIDYRRALHLNTTVAQTERIIVWTGELFGH